MCNSQCTAPSHFFSLLTPADWSTHACALVQSKQRLKEVESELAKLPRGVPPGEGGTHAHALLREISRDLETIAIRQDSPNKRFAKKIRELNKKFAQCVA